MKFLILNGPNLNLLGTREQDIYGEKTLEEIISEIKSAFPSHHILAFQSNHEGQLIDWIHQYGFDYDGLVINAGAYSHTSIALADAVRAITSPVVEVHISDVYKREKFRHFSFLTEVCEHHIIGGGIQGYHDALNYLIDRNNESLKS